MCGIAGLVLKQRMNTDLAKTIGQMAQAIRHRGPDGEGFITADDTGVTPWGGAGSTPLNRNHLPYLPTQALQNSSGAYLAFAHRRLSIIDLSEGGHQPMCASQGRYWITYNGEVYNYIELRAELQELGHRFVSDSDTEVILNAYAQWGSACVERFNGMWAFCIYDRAQQQLFASRDRLGVKPFYFCDQPHHFSFASEQKAFVSAGLLPAKASGRAVYNYLLNSLLETEPANFFEGLTELWPGHNLSYDIASATLRTWSYFHLSDHVSLANNGLSNAALIEKTATVFENAVKLRLRSDVEVGTCLSGGLDSSALAVTMAEMSAQPLYCFTSVFKHETFNEERWANDVANKIHAKHFTVEPSLNDFLTEADALIYSQDVPIWSTSTYAQYKVMQLAARHSVKVVLDGQGADELFGGYHHHLVAYWNNLLAHGHFRAAWREIAAGKISVPQPFLFFLKDRLKQRVQFNTGIYQRVFTEDFRGRATLINPNTYFSDVNAQLLDDIYRTRLKSFLKCEDRCGMAHSVESRTPFSDDIHLIQLLFSVSGNRKIKDGVTKYLLREAVKSKLPESVYTRYDKTGFETPMNKWVDSMRPHMMEVISLADFDFLKPGALQHFTRGKSFDNNLLFRLFVLARWKTLFGASV